MTNISVSTAGLSSNVYALQSLSREAEQHARDVVSVLHQLDLEIAAREGFDSRLRYLSSALSAQSWALANHGHFLSMAAARYEGIESTLVGRVPHGSTSGSGEARAGLFGAPVVAAAGGSGLLAAIWARTGPARRVLMALDDAVGEAEKLGGKPVTIIGNLIGEIPVVGQCLTVGAMLNEMEDGDYTGMLWEARGFIPRMGLVEGAWTLGTGIGEFIADDLGLSDWWIENVGVADWATDAYASAEGGIRDAQQFFSENFDAGVDAIRAGRWPSFGEMGEAFSTGAEQIWDWVTP